MKRLHDLSYSTIELRDDGFVWFISKPGAIHDGEYTRKIMEIYKGLAEGQPILVYADVRGLATATSDSRQIAVSDEFREVIKAMAVLIDSPLSRVIANFFTRVSKPPYPTRVFTDEAEALAWLATHRDSD